MIYALSGMNIVQDEDTFIKWVNNSKPGEKIIYAYTPNLNIKCTDKEISRIAWRTALEGKIYLTQKRYQGSIQYFAIKASNKPINRLIPSDFMPEGKEPRKRTKYNGA